MNTPEITPGETPTYTITYGPMTPPGTYTPKGRLNVRAYPSTTSAILRQVRPYQPIMVFGYWIDLKRDEYWVAVDPLLSEWVAHRHRGEWLGALVFDDLALGQKEEE